MIYKFTPNTRTDWRYVWVGALVAAILYEAARAISAWYFTRYANYELIYGAITSTIIFLVWIYYTAYVLIIGAEVASEYTRLKEGMPPKRKKSCALGPRD